MIESALMDSNKTKPALRQFSIVTALLALNLSIIFFLPAEPACVSLNLFGIAFTFSAIQLIPFFIAGISVVGSYWVLITNPDVSRKAWLVRQVVPNIVLPTITILIFALILMQTDKSLAWWGIFAIGLFAYTVVFYSEYQILKESVSGSTIFSVLLIALAHALFLAFVIALRASVTRFFILIPGIMLASAFVSYRTIFLRSEGKFRSFWIAVVVVLCTQFAIALYYLFITPNQYGLILTAVLFTGNALVTRIGQGDRKHLYIEPLALVLFIALLILFTKLV